MDTVGTAEAVTRTLPHQRMIQAWRLGRAKPVSPQIITYVRYDGAWWRRTGPTWESIPDGPFALSLSAGQARLDRAHRATGILPQQRGRDPWTVARNRHRAGVACGKSPMPCPMRATDLRPYPPAVCRVRRTT